MPYCFFTFSSFCVADYVVLVSNNWLFLGAYTPLLQVKPALPALASLIHSNDEEVLTDACWALSYLSDGTNDKIQGVIEAGVCIRLVELLLWVFWISKFAVQSCVTLLFCFQILNIIMILFRHTSPSVLIPALRTVGNIVTGDDLQTQVLGSIIS